ncbi:aminotransferase class I/II-fold pyridoxal phosphate-dependent enzyme [Mariniflexile sp. AS56]|uniref:aminotransferase class I/II-fold pyridoxal phosphate-dependent enzyme n=1 Tax=Mariniflexile sp. AS56 TaxID=3063957 RepID=UPI0026EAB9BF|nr:aminotransferase class I/II-fold pyridoxal phosphate-dependent enzyme [Mariniflexile sp. AS56]MDO7172063.1 aminotransferase class I/II-fold pyridoxal phosphate-dependent enzyme [Mariniflexile sp. AS56]
MVIDGFPDREIIVNGQPFLYFGGTSYLGLSTNEAFQNNLISGIKKWGTSYGSSRNANVKLSVYEKAEHLFSEVIGAEAVVTCSSGALAGKLVVEHLSKHEITFYHYPKTHPAILHKSSVPLFVNGKLHPNLLNNTNEAVVITVDALLGLEVEPTAFHFLNEISSQKKVTLVLDESHSLGIVGEHLKGVFSTISHEKLFRKIMVSSLGKALGISGGIIAADTGFIEALKQEPDFVSSSSINPAYLDAFLVSQDIIKAQRKKLQNNLDFLFEGLILNSDFKFHKEYPVIYCEDERLCDFLYEQGIVMTHFKYPTYKTAMSRIVITANHTQNDLLKLKQSLIAFNG